jgi:tRNA(His) 5'-end guanylyltransferase
MKDIIGDKIKKYEKVITSIKLDDTKPIIIRLDGNNFSTFTKNLTKPFDKNFSLLMEEISKFALLETGADFSYSQSDELTLIYFPRKSKQTFFNKLISFFNKTKKNENKSQFYHDGKLYKILSKLASKVSVRFNSLLPKYLPNKVGTEPIFDCRIFNVPNNDLVFGTIKWRFRDARRNSILNASYWTLGHNQIANKNTGEMLSLLLDNGIDWETYPVEFKYGTFFKRELVKNKLTEEELKTLPLKHNARKNPEMEFERTIIQKYNFDNIKEVREFILNNLN